LIKRERSFNLRLFLDKGQRERVLSRESKRELSNESSLEKKGSQKNLPFFSSSLSTKRAGSLSKKRVKESSLEKKGSISKKRAKESFLKKKSR